ncbi:hypothetical protein GCM10028796_05320 [Ramlibacter monticola]|uniref:Uncharacterized protein n=1 Tax=Ramlibacter monticola TaxID=1926872 RepID=A0A936YZ51_9BURK|nr:hypothetical protein [Ramlibacter monticola]MBL0391191.1 hypothetical protein [Ramlibacter monticola]
MWELKDHKFGGLPGVHPRGEARFIDPVEVQFVSVRNELHAENWMLRRFDPETLRLEVPQSAHTAVIGGTAYQERFSLIVDRRDGTRFADVVVARPISDVRQHALRAVAAEHGLQACVRSREMVRANGVHIANVSMMRQRMTLYAKIPCEIEQQDVVRSLVREPMTRIELMEVLRNSKGLQYVEQMDCLIFRAYLAKLIDFDIQVPYGPRTVLQAL